MKRFAVLVAAAVAVVGLAGCGSNTASDKNAGNIKLTMNQLDSKKILTSKAFDVDTDGGYYKLSGKAAPGQTVVLLDSYDDYDEEEPTANEEMRTKADKNGDWKFDDYLVTSANDKKDKYQVAAVTTDKKVVDIAKKKRGNKDFYINDLSNKIKFFAPKFKDAPVPSSSGSKSKETSSSKNSSTSSSTSSSDASSTSSSSKNVAPAIKPKNSTDLKTLSSYVKDDNFSGAAIVNGILTLVLRNESVEDSLVGFKGTQKAIFNQINFKIKEVQSNPLAKNGILVTGAYATDNDGYRAPLLAFYYNPSDLQNDTFGKINDYLAVFKNATSSYVDAGFVKATMGSLGIIPESGLRKNLQDPEWFAAIWSSDKTIKSNETITFTETDTE